MGLGKKGENVYTEMGEWSQGLKLMIRQRETETIKTTAGCGGGEQRGSFGYI